MSGTLSEHAAIEPAGAVPGEPHADHRPRVGVVLAAGRSERLAGVTGGGSKALVRVGGRSLVERAVRGLLAEGIRRAVVVVGYQAGPVAAVVDRLAPGRVRAAFAEDWEIGNGASLAAAEPHLAGEDLFMLVTTDHIFGDGALAALARGRGSPLVTVEAPPGRMPRAALWSLLVPVCSAAEAAGVLPPLRDQVLAAADALDAEAAALGPAVPTDANPAKQAALRLLDRLPVVWGSGQLGAVAATRFRTECNENAKVPVVSAALPEANHNDVMGLEGGLGPGRVLVLLRDEAGEHERDGLRIAAALEALGIDDPVVCRAGEGHELVRLARLTAFSDFASTYLAIARGVDPTPIRTLDRVKAALSATSR